MISERELQRVWALGLFRGPGLRTEDGRAVEVLFPGFPAAGDGPDFTAARIAIGGEERSGDVELHLAPSGWRQHRHAADGAYANVILHVALRRDPFAGRREGFGGKAIPELVLEPHLDVSQVDLRRLLGGTPRPPPGREAAWLAGLGDLRFARRRERFREAARRLGIDDAVYRSVMTGLGWRRNKAGFAELARLVLWRTLAGRPEEEIRGLLRSAATGLPWRRVGVRPANRPERRIEGMVRLAASIGPRGWLASARGARDPENFFDPSGGGFIGRRRALELWTAAILPALGASALFASWPALPENRRIREARAALELPPVATLREQWGLLEWREGQG